MVDRQRDDDEQEDCYSQQQPKEHNGYRQRLGHTALQPNGDWLNPERDERGNDENRYRAGYVPREPKRGQQYDDGGDRDRDSPPEVGSYSGLHSRRRSVRYPACS